MGGAQRSARKRRQNQTAGGGVATSTGSRGAAAAKSGPAGRKASPVAAARRSGGNRNPIIIGAVVVVVIAAAVIGGVIYTNSQKSATEGAAIAPKSVSVSVPVTRDGAVVVVGKADAKATVDVYEDFLCPACRSFEDTYAGQIEGKLTDGTLKVRFHMLNMLNDRSDPAGYSTDSANAALLAADEGKFLAFHKSLFANQPAEGARGWTKEQLITLGSALGLTSQSFTDGVRSGKYDQQITDAFNQVRNTDYLQQEYNGQKAFGTPTLAANNKVIDTTDPNWLTALTS
ncbi:DsbA family protein [Actinokineospora cianjurensis]|uniref:Protein-disulfide isomerase n=1 Tax=Actinokineospora cianjurensis TaxID=585224 RepID=A0A421AW05_9PSEU|nr:thioredoxin domain-containing protein [Actinokineospora cianjurensis]RLK54198.1 protein-disulfide isomerase [Actinokineospora cianjurensis]